MMLSDIIKPNDLRDIKELANRKWQEKQLTLPEAYIYAIENYMNLKGYIIKEKNEAGE